MNPLRPKAGIILLLVALVGQASIQGFRDHRRLLETDRLLRPPFQEGEKLQYEVNWKPLFAVPAFKAGELKMRIQEAEFGGAETYKISAWASSDNVLTRVAGLEVRNYFESHIDRRDYRSYRLLQQIRQGRRTRDLELVFDYDNDETVIRETDPSTTPPRELKNKTVKGIPDSAIDVLSVFYVARLHKVRPGDRFLLNLNEKGRFKEVQVLAEKRENVETPVGNFPAIRLATKGGLFKDGGDFRIWYSTDRLRIPVKFEADVKFGKVYGSLIRVETPRQTRSLIKVN
jgi:hypothetical protein